MKDMRWKNRNIGRRRLWRYIWYVKSEMLVSCPSVDVGDSWVDGSGSDEKAQALQIWEVHVTSS